MKKLSIRFLLIFIISLLPVLQGCAKATFEISNLIISPQEVEAGQSAIVSVDIANTGGAEGTYAVILKIDSAQSDEKNVTVQAGTTKQANFTITLEQEGSYSIDVNGLTSILNVVRPPKPAGFVASDLTINPNEFNSGSKTIIQVTVTNIGELSGSYDVNLKIDDKVEATESITLAGGANQNVTFAISKSIAKTYEVNIGELSGTFVVKSKPTPPPVVSPPPAEFKVAALRVSPTEVLAGSSATVIVDVTNVSQVKGDYQVTLKVNNKDVETKIVSLTGGVTETVSFTLIQDQVGNYNVSVDGQSGTLVVKISPGASSPPFPGDTIADLTLQADVMGIIRLYEMVFGNPNPTIINTRMTKSLTTDGAWAERWIVERSGVTVAYDIKFQRDPKGGCFFGVSRAEI